MSAKQALAIALCTGLLSVTVPTSATVPASKSPHAASALKSWPLPRPWQQPLFSDAQVTLYGQATQGALLLGKLQRTDRQIVVELDGDAINVTPDGYFLIGFNRDAAPEATLTLRRQGSNEVLLEKTLAVAPRQYAIDRVNGVAQKYVAPPKAVTERIARDNQQIGEARATLSERMDFLQPVKLPLSGRISGVYGSQRIFNGEPKNPHFGLDIAAKKGTPFYAPLPGKVLLAVPDMYYSGGTLIIDHGLGLTSTYIHMNKISVKVGDVVDYQTVLGEVGATGRVTGPHLDWRFNWRQVRLDPALLLSEPLPQ